MTSLSSDLDVSIIVVSWNVEDYLDKCLASIARYTKIGHEVIIVDSASADGSVAMVRRKYPEVKLIAAKENLGFTRGNNVGLAQASGRYIAYVNPDIELIEDAVSPLVAYLDEHPQVGIVGPKLLNPDRSLQSSIGRFTRLSSLLNEYILRQKAGQHVLPHPDTPTTVEFVMGAFLVVRGDICREIGGFDERYFMYHDETDMCLTFLKRGFSTVYYPMVSVIHYGSQSAGKTSQIRQRTLHENRKSQYLFFQKQYSWLTAQIARLIILWAMVSRIAILGLRNYRRNGQVDREKITYYRQTVSWLLNH